MTEQDFIDKWSTRFYKSVINGIMSRVNRDDGLIVTHDFQHVLPIRHWCRLERLRAERMCAND